MSSLGTPLLSLAAAAGPLPAQQAIGDARLYAPADQMYALRLAAGAPVLVSVAASGANDRPAPLAELFASRQQAAPPPALPGQLGGLAVAAELWPAQGLQKGSAALPPVLRDALARPQAGARLLVFAAAEGISGGGAQQQALQQQQQGEQQQECTHVYLRMCQRQGGGEGDTAASAAPLPALLPQEDAAGLAADDGGSMQQSPQQSGPRGPSSRNSSGAVQSPAMRGGGAPPVALSPAMRGAAAPPVGLSPGGSKGRAGSSSGGGGGNARRPPSTPPPSSRSSSSGPGARSGRQAAPLAQVSDRAKAEGVLGTILSSTPSARVRRMLEALLLRQLAGRRLLPGNLVTLPLFGQQALFVVEGVSTAAAAAESQPEDAAAQAQQQLPPPVTSSTAVRLLVGDEAAPSAGGSGVQQQQPGEDWPALAAAAAAEALGCSVDDAGPMAARRAMVAGLASRRITFDDLGGMAQQRQALRELVALPLQSPHLFSQYSITPPRGVLLHGPPGTGKTLLACATASLASARFFVVNGPEVVSEYYGESEAGLRGIFAAAAALAPSVVFIDELDAVAPARDAKPGSGAAGSSGGASARVVATLLTEMDALGPRVVLVAATNRPDSLDAALRRPGRFDREVEVGVPSPADRRHILSQQLRGMAHDMTDQQVAELADAAHGYVAADLAALCNEAALTALRRVVQGSRSDGSASAACCITLADFRAAETRTRPSAMRELAFEIPKVSWDDIGGLDDVKQRIREVVELPFQQPGALARLGVVPPRGVLLHGPPGCSKTLLARAVASQSRLNFISVKGPELFSKYVGESEKALASLFAKARAAAPCVIFFDEIDGLATFRDSSGAGGVSVGERMLSQLLQEMDGLQPREGVIVIGATNRPDCLDPALLRPGRFDRLLAVPPPDCAGRAAIFGVHTRAMPLAPDVDLRALAEQGRGLTGAAIAACCKEAALTALEEDMAASCVAMRHFQPALASQSERLQRVKAG